MQFALHHGCGLLQKQKKKHFLLQTDDKQDPIAVLIILMAGEVR